MALMEIPEGSIEIQTGLYLYTYTRTIAGTGYTFRQLYSSEGYCFWEVNNPENYDEEGNLKPENERVYVQFAALAISYTTVEQINADFISVPIQEGFEIVSVPTDTETA